MIKAFKMVAKSITYYQYIIVCCILAYHLGAIHKRRLLRGGGRGSPLKANLRHKPV